jgi:hypothetical protein
MPFVLRNIAFGIALVVVVGCKLVDEQPKGRSPLAPVASSPDQVTLEVFSAPAPLDDPRWQTLWSEVDEQSLSPQLRLRLARNGMRVGVIGARMPDALASLLKVTDERVSEEDRIKVPLDGKPSVVMRLMQPSPGKRQELILTSVRDRLSLLRNRAGEVVGKTYAKAEGRLAMHVFPESGGEVRLELVPELHHGEPKTQTTPSDGMFILTTQRDKEVFSELKIEASLAPGEVLLLTSLEDCTGSIGHQLFVRTEGETPLRTLWALRIAKAGGDRAFADWDTQPSESDATDQSD